MKLGKVVLQSVIFPTLLGLLLGPLFGVTGEERIFRIVAFGDSTTAPHDSIEKVYAQRLAEMLTPLAPQVVVVNAGVRRDTTIDAGRRFQADVLERSPDLVIIQFGLNDSAVEVRQGKSEPRVSRQVYEDNLHDFVRTLKSSGSGVILMTPNPMLWTPRLRSIYTKPPYDLEDRWGLNWLNAEYAGAVRRVARAHDVPLVDVYQLYADHDREQGRSADALLLDGKHPNDGGHQLIAESLMKQILPLLGMLPPAPGYGIPIVDLAAERPRQVIVDREEGQYLGHPTTVLLEDQRTMIAVYPKGHGRGAIVMKRSLDGGLTWSDRLPVPGSWATSLEVPTLYRVVDRKRVRRLILFSGLYPVRMSVSEDDGQSWTPLEPLGDWGGIVAMASVERLADGDYMALFHDDGRFLRDSGRRARTMWVYKTISPDGGLTWSQPEVITTHPLAHLCEPGLIRSPDGKQMAVLLRENSRTRNSFVIFSDDEGQTWTAPRELPGALTGDRHSGKYAADGRLFISFRDTTHESPTRGDWVGWVGTYEDIRRGWEGQYRVRLMDNHKAADCAYPAVELLPDGTFVTTTYGHWQPGEEPYIVSVHFRLEELDHKVAQLQGRR